MTAAVTAAQATPASRPMGLGSGLWRAALAFLVVVVADGWLVFARDAFLRSGNPLDAATHGVADVVRFAFPFLIFLALALLPAFVASIELGARFAGTSRLRWAAIGGGVWFAWTQLVIQTVLTAGTFPIYEDLSLPVAIAAAASGAVVGLIGCRGDEPVRPGRLLLGVGTLIGAVMLIGAFVTLGWWGGPT